MQPERKMIGTQTIKEEHVEIALPNRPSSSSSNETKKRKLSSIQTAPCNENGSSLVNIPTSMPSHQGKEQSSENLTEQTETNKLDDSILNSEVYKIYCQHIEKWEAANNIRKLKYCCEVDQSYLNENEKKLKHAVDAIWSSVPQKPKPFEGGFWSYHSLVNVWKKIEEVKIPINGEGRRKNATIGELFMNSLTKIVLIQPNGYEVLLVRDFEKGPGVSKWYRGYAYTMDRAFDIAKLNVRGVTIPATETISRTIPWRDFAESIMDHRIGIVCQSFIQLYFDSWIN